MNRRFIMLLVFAPLLLALCLAFGAAGNGFPALAWDNEILWLRLTRVLAGFVTGAALAVAGVVLQAVLRNPLAEPYVLGVSSGAGLGAASAILGGLGVLGAWPVPVAAFAGSVLSLALVYGLANDHGRVPIYGLILSGVIVSAVASSLLMFMVTLAPVEGLHSVLWWMLGNLEVSSVPLLMVASAGMLVGCAVAWVLAPELNALTLGTDMAHHLGVRIRVVVGGALLCATLITASAVALAGLIGFVGLIVPHALRAWLGPEHRRLIPAAALGGGTFLAVCDALARTALAPVEIPVGVVTALLGGPFFLLLLRRRRGGGWLE